MTTQNAYVLHDIKAKTYGPIMFQENDVIAHRVMEQSMKNKEQTFAQYPSDFNLVKIGTYDTFEGKLIPCEHEILANLSNYVQ